MVIKKRDKGYYSTLSKREFDDLGKASFWDVYCAYEKFIGSDFYAIDGDKIYIQDEYLYKVWLVYLSLLQCSIHENLIANYDCFENVMDIADDALDNQTSVPLLFQKFSNDFKGAGWYFEDSIFSPVKDLIGVGFEKALENPLSGLSLHQIQKGLHKDVTYI